MSIGPAPRREPGTPPVPGLDEPVADLGSGLRARPMELADVPAVHRLETELFPADAWPLDMFLAELVHPTRRYTVVEAADAPGVQAYCGVMVVAETADVQTVAVRPEHQGRGIGRALMERMHEQAARLGAETMMLEVRADNPRARGLYESLGYRRIHVRRGYYQDGTDAEIMQRPLPAAPAGGDPARTEGDTP